MVLVVLLALMGCNTRDLRLRTWSPGLDTADGRPEQFDPIEDFFHDVPHDVRTEAFRRGEPPQSDRPFADPWPLASWPDVPTRFLQGRDDRLFPLAFQRRVVAERLGIEVEEMPGGHLVALSQPAALADRLDSMATDAG